MTYESASEAEVLKALWRPGAPLENTLFAILDPYGRPLTRGTRSPGWLFRDPADMAAGLADVARHYQSTGNPQSLPAIATVRLGMNVAACDKLPLAIVVGDTEKERQAMERTLAPVAWSDGLIGKLTYTAGTRTDLNDIQGPRPSRGYLFVSPNEFGTAGTVIAQLNATATPAELKAAMQMTIDRHHPLSLDHREHIQWGREQGISWTTAIPITDPHELQAQQFDPQRGPAGEGSLRPNSSRPNQGGPGQGGLSQGESYTRAQYPRGFGIREYGRPDPNKTGGNFNSGLQ